MKCSNVLTVVVLTVSHGCERCSLEIIVAEHRHWTKDGQNFNTTALYLSTLLCPLTEAHARSIDSLLHTRGYMYSTVQKITNAVWSCDHTTFIDRAFAPDFAITHQLACLRGVSHLIFFGMPPQPLVVLSRLVVVVRHSTRRYGVYTCCATKHRTCYAGGCPSC